MQQIVIGLCDVNLEQREKLESKISNDAIIVDKTSQLTNLPKNSLVELIGAWEDGCILGAIEESLINNNIVRVPKGYTVLSSYFEMAEKEYPGLKDYFKKRLVTDKSELAESDYQHRENKKYHFFIPKTTNL